MSDNRQKWDYPWSTGTVVSLWLVTEYTELGANLCITQPGSVKAAWCCGGPQTQVTPSVDVQCRERVAGQDL